MISIVDKCDVWTNYVPLTMAAKDQDVASIRWESVWVLWSTVKTTARPCLGGDIKLYSWFYFQPRSKCIGATLISFIVGIIARFDRKVSRSIYCCVLKLLMETKGHLDDLYLVIVIIEHTELTTYLLFFSFSEC